MFTFRSVLLFQSSRSSIIRNLKAATTTCAFLLSSSSGAKGFNNNQSINTHLSNRFCNMSTTAKYSNNLEVAQFPCLDDNYGYLIHDIETGDTAAVDTPDAKTYQNELDKRGWKLSHIFCTHHHWDHTGGNVELKKDGVKVYGAEADKERIPAIDIALHPEDKIQFGNSPVRIIDVSGHTTGHIAYHFNDNNVIFVGDALFSLGCGKMFEGTPPMFWSTMERLRALSDDTTVYCAHEYTMGNAKFAVSVEPGNEKLQQRYEDIITKRQRGEPTVPSLMGEEKETNPFLRGDISAEIRKNVGAENDDDPSVIFGKIRKSKDCFRG